MFQVTMPRRNLSAGGLAGSAAATCPAAPAVAATPAAPRKPRRLTVSIDPPTAACSRRLFGVSNVLDKQTPVRFRIRFRINLSQVPLTIQGQLTALVLRKIFIEEQKRPDELAN